MKKSIWLCLPFLFASCYSFRGVNISPDIKTISIHFIENKSSIIEPTLSQTFTETLKTKFLQGTNLNQIENDGDLDLSGSINSYLVSPISATGNQTAGMNRLTISITINFVNQKDEKQSWTSSFSRYADYESSQSLSAVQSLLITQINDQLADDIFNKAVVNW